ncbi:MAG: sigma-54 dependent transcriptional regulator [Holosporales bacterium]|jgi:two-component system nitrogen regulation response regulator NtrX|nr:sigma-54 dependent transcriptional regulator [Holosporales bacterium]
MAFNILVVDDEADIRELVSGILCDNGYETSVASGYVDAICSIRTKRPSLVIIDVWLGDGDRDGIRLLDAIKADHGYIPVIMMSGHGTIGTAVTAIRRGAYDFIEKPFDSRRLIMSVEKAIEASKLQAENAELKIKAKVSDSIPGKSQNVLHIRQQISRIAPLNGRCVIISPRGSDREIVARNIHNLSGRARGPFVAFNCLSTSVHQLEANLFGTELNDGASTIINPGLLEKVNGGTLFVDEIVTAPHAFQLKLLKLIKEDSFVRIGSSERISADIRIIASFPLNIQQLIEEGEVSDELYCRLNANTVKILPLKSRREDIPYLLNYFMEQVSMAYNVAPRKFSSEAVGVLNAYHWPGDTMQMKSMIEWVMTVALSGSDSSRGVITLNDLPKEIMEEDVSGIPNMKFISMVSELSIRDARETFEREYFIDQLRKFSGNISQTAKFVGMERSALHRKLRSLNIVDSKLFKMQEA